MKLSLKKRTFSCLQFWPLAIALPLFMLVLSYYQLFFMDTPFFWWARSTIYYAVGFALCLVPLSLIIVFMWFLRLSFRESAARAPLLGAGLSLVLLVLVNVSMCAATLVTILGDYRYHDMERFGNHVYRLDSEWKIGVGGDSRAVFSLLKCDSAGLICEFIYTYRYLNDDHGSLVSEYEYRAIEASLVADPKTRSITIQIDGQSIYTYFP
jgi:hypothetical protein